MQKALILRQGLRHRALLLLIRSSNGQNLLRSHKEGFLDFSSQAMLPADQSPLDFARYLLDEEWHCPTCRLKLAGLWQACPENGNALTSIVEARLSLPSLVELSHRQEQSALLGTAEMLNMAHEQAHFLSPILCSALLCGLVRSPRQNH